MRVLTKAIFLTLLFSQCAWFAEGVKKITDVLDPAWKVQQLENARNLPKNKALTLKQKIDNHLEVLKKVLSENQMKEIAGIAITELDKIKKNFSKKVHDVNKFPFFPGIILDINKVITPKLQDMVAKKHGKDFYNKVRHLSSSSDPSPITTFLVGGKQVAAVALNTFSDRTMMITNPDDIGKKLLKEALEIKETSKMSMKELESKFEKIQRIIEENETPSFWKRITTGETERQRNITAGNLKLARIYQAKAFKEKTKPKPTRQPKTKRIPVGMSPAEKAHWQKAQDPRTKATRRHK